MALVGFSLISYDKLQSQEEAFITDSDGLCYH